MGLSHTGKLLVVGHTSYYFCLQIFRLYDTLPCQVKWTQLHRGHPGNVSIDSLDSVDYNGCLPTVVPMDGVIFVVVLGGKMCYISTSLYSHDSVHQGSTTNKQITK